MNDLEDWLDKLKNSNKLILVEGKKDKIALEEFNINNIITINKPIYQLVEEISLIRKECVLLLDLDKEGKKLYSEIKNGLQKNGVKVDSKFREFLFKNTKLSHIEGLKNYVRRRI